MTKPRGSPAVKSRSAAPVGVDRWVVGLAAAGLVVSAYLTITKLVGTAPAFCEAGRGCDVVQASRYATFVGLPTAAWGVGLYVVVGALALVGLTARRWRAAFVLAVAGAAFSLYLSWLQLAVVRAFCGYCAADAAIAIALLGVLVVRRPHAVVNRPWGRPTRLAALAGAVAVATVVFALAGFMGETPQEATARQEALARHLSAAGAVFYGAYW